MAETWGSSTLGRLFTRAIRWSLSLDGDRFELDLEGKTGSESVAQLENLSVECGAFWATVSIAFPSGKTLVVDGIGNDKAAGTQANRERSPWPNHQVLPDACQEKPA